MSACNNSTDFIDAWSLVKGRFQALRRFFGGPASALPGASQVESDSFAVKGENDIFCRASTDLSLEGVLHSKQLDKLAMLWTQVKDAVSRELIVSSNLFRP